MATTESTKPSPTAGETPKEDKKAGSLKGKMEEKKKEAEEYVVPAADVEEEELKAKDFKTSDDAQVAFLQGKIDENTFAAVVGRFGKPNNPPYARHAEVDGAYERDLPKWAFTAPEGIGLTVEERQELVQEKAEERENMEPGLIRSDTGEIKKFEELGTPYSTPEEAYSGVTSPRPKVPHVVEDDTADTSSSTSKKSSSSTGTSDSSSSSSNS